MTNPSSGGGVPGDAHGWARPRRAEDPPAKLYVEPTSECNLNCRTCIRHSWDEKGGFMEWALFERLVEEFAGLAEAGTVVFAGLGEPLLHPRFVDMVTLAHQRGLRTELTSNALLLTPQIAAGLLAAHLDQFVVSIDGATAETFGDVRGASLGHVVRNMRYLNDRKGPYYSPSIRVGIEFVAMRRNVHELPALRQLAAEVDASFIVVSNVLPYTEDLIDETLYRDRTTALSEKGLPRLPRWYLPHMEWNDDTAEPLAQVLRRTNAVSYLDADLSATVSHCPFVQAGAVAVRWDGGVTPCPPLLHSYHYFVKGREKTFRRCVLGSLHERTLAQIWADPGYEDLRRRVLAFEFPPCVDCGGCELAEQNEEDCYGNPFPVCGDCLWARGVVRCA